MTARAQAHVAVIGAGPCGIAVARELLREGHRVTVFEASGGVGGAWNAGSSGAIYDGLRTNLPRYVMGMAGGHPFIPAAMGGHSLDARVYPGRAEVLTYCEALAAGCGLDKHLQLHTRVLRLDPISSTSSSSSEPLGAGGWSVLTEHTDGPHASEDAGGGSASAAAPRQREWRVDAVAVCTGIFDVPHTPPVPGADVWPGQQLHSRHFRDASPFAGKRVLVVGASFSGEEIARLIADRAAVVWHSARTFTGPGTAREAPQQQHQHQQHPSDQQQPQHAEQGDVLPAPQPRANITRLPMLQALRRDGGAVFADGRVLSGLDAVVHCTGYQVSLPFLQHLGLVRVEQGCVSPLFAHMFVPRVGASLALCGLPWRCAKFPQFQLQGQLLARLLSGRAQLPPQPAMEQDQQQQFAAMRTAGVPRRYAHCLAVLPEGEAAYADRLVALAATGSSSSSSASGLVCMPPWMKALAAGIAGVILTEPDTFRDSWSGDVDVLLRAAEDACGAEWQAGCRADT